MDSVQEEQDGIDTCSKCSSFDEKLCHRLRIVSLIFLSLMLILIFCATFAAVAIYWRWNEKIKDPKTLICNREVILWQNDVWVRMQINTLDTCLQLNQSKSEAFPVIMRPPVPNLYVYRGDNFKASCVAFGIPIPTIVWLFKPDDSQSVQPLPNKCCSSSLNGVGIVNCANVQQEHKGTYICQAFNTVGKINSNSSATNLYIIENNMCDSALR